MCIRALLCLCFMGVISAKLDGLQVGSLIRTQNDVEAFIKFYACINGVPESALSAFIKKQSEQVKTFYMELLRKKEFIKSQDPSALKSPDLIRAVEYRLKSLSDKLSKYGVKTYIAREYLMIMEAYEKVTKKFGHLGVQISQADVLNETNKLSDASFDSSAYSNAYLIAEIELDTTHFDDKSERGILENVNFLLNQMPLDLFTLAFCKNINAGIGGSMGLINETMLSKDLLKMMAGEAINVRKKDGKVVLYIKLAKRKPEAVEKPTLKQIEKYLLKTGLQQRQYDMWFDSYGGLVSPQS